MIKAILFDLDGTLLPMDMIAFVKDYLQSMTEFLAPHGYDPEKLNKALWAGTEAMMKTPGEMRNETLFWQVFNSVIGKDAREDAALFEEFYAGLFQQSKTVCGFQPAAAEAIAAVKALGFRLALATNPVFPAAATHSRVRWAGLEPSDFELITSYENSHYCKPNPDYYREILGKLELDGSQCLMVGNDTDEDMAAREVGMQVFLLTDCLINRTGKNLEDFPHGGFPELLQFIRSM